jgi:hypothetical protein
MTNESSMQILPLDKIEETGLGLVYILKRSSNSKIIKIGHTSKTSESRALNYTDGEWIAHQEYSMPIWLAKLTERSAHALLSKFWLDPKLTGGSASEIFTCSLEEGEIAVQMAYIEQLEKALNLLRLPETLVKLILKEKGLSSEISLSTIELGLEEINIKRYAEIQTLKHDLIDLQIKNNNLQNKLTETNERELAALSSYNKKIEHLQTELTELRKSITSSTSELDYEIAILDKISEKKINMRDFEVLRDGFRKAIKIIINLRLENKF